MDILSCMSGNGDNNGGSSDACCSITAKYVIVGFEITDEAKSQAEEIGIELKGLLCPCPSDDDDDDNGDD